MGIRVFLFVLIILFSESAYAGSLKFALVPPDPLLAKVMGNIAWWIYAEGEIDADAGGRLEQLITKNKIPNGSFIVLSSPGGNLIGGMKLGRVIRKHFLNTDIGVEDKKSSICASACAVAYLGGDFRFLRQGSLFGVHRFFFSQPTPNESDIAQMLSALEIAYFQEMGIDPELFSVAVQAGKESAVFPSRSELKRLNVVNDGVQKVKWTLESLPDVIYLKGERDTLRGINKFLIVCGKGHKPYLHVIFDAGRQANEIMPMKAESLVIDDNNIAIEKHHAGRYIQNGWLNAMFTLDENLLSKLQGAKTVGFALQSSHDAPIFVGFNDMPFGDGAKKLPGLLSVCAGQAKR